MMQVPTLGHSWGKATCLIVTKSIKALQISQTVHIYFDGGVFYSTLGVKEKF